MMDSVPDFDQLALHHNASIEAIRAALLSQPDRLEASVLADTTGNKRQRSRSEQASYAADTCCNASTWHGPSWLSETSLLSREKPIGRSSWPSSMQFGSYNFSSKSLESLSCSSTSSMGSEQISGIPAPSCSSPSSRSSGTARCPCSSCYSGTPSSMCITHSQTSTMNSSSTAGSESTSASLSCWSSLGMRQTSRRATDSFLSPMGNTWLLPQHGNRQVLAEYEFGQTLGCGTFGVTRLVTHKATARPWACKTICKASIAASPAAQMDVQHEVAILQHLAGHSGIVQLQGVFEDTRSIHLVMEVCTGGDLLDYISRFDRLAESEAADIACTILTTLQHCHKLGVVHRDIKPENFLLGAPTMLLSPAGSAAATLKISDFGVSAFYSQGQRFAEIVGTPYYMAPEVLERCYGPEADIWSVGVVIYLMLAGCLPFNGTTDRQIIKAVMDSEPDYSHGVWPSISDAAKDFVRSMLVKDPAKRASIEQLLQHQWLQGAAASSSTSMASKQQCDSSSSTYCPSIKGSSCVVDRHLGSDTASAADVMPAAASYNCSRHQHSKEQQQSSDTNSNSRSSSSRPQQTPNSSSDSSSWQKVSARGSSCPGSNLYSCSMQHSTSSNRLCCGRFSGSDSNSSNCWSSADHFDSNLLAQLAALSSL